ncbi:hypothetical protein EW146_g5418 [Bondarzewia mesenterica]|uniref:F-box domain-containing protein n=1 Tax=Bondarzewia mesenterica TaxID=1095465 RepID=A0A4S4LSK4_9AGAM|nr:hypothetical protein EW146_g5418 [Bondarzewia mesenterica]
MSSSSQGSTVIGESEELKRFREQWKAEVTQKKQSISSPATALSSQSNLLTSPTLPAKQSSSDASIPSDLYDSLQPVEVPTPSTPTPSSFISNGSIRARNNAITVYRQAVRCEQASQLDEALRLYRTAFRMDPDVDKAFHKAEQVLAAASAPRTGHKKTSSVDSTVERITQAVNELDLSSAHVHRHRHEGHVTGLLAKVLKNFPDTLSFEPEDETASTPLKYLPDELLIFILRYLNPNALERFGAVCRKARVLTLESSIWRYFVETAYKPPQIAEDDDLGSIVNEFSMDYRRVFIERPRGFFIGNWVLNGTAVVITNLYDPANTSARYSFQMTLALRSRPLGRWNKLEFVGYDSVDADGEATPLALKNERPFWFSKVRSYSAAVSTE